MAIYMELTLGKVIKGDVTAKGYEDWIELDSMSFGASRDVSMEVGAMKNREFGMPYIQAIACSKQLDASSPMLVQKALASMEAGKATICFVRTGDGDPDKIGEFKLEQVVISDYSFAGSMGGRPSESMSISYGKIEINFEGADKENKNGTNIKVAYDLVTGKPG